MSKKNAGDSVSDVPVWRLLPILMSTFLAAGCIHDPAGAPPRPPAAYTPLDSSRNALPAPTAPPPAAAPNVAPPAAAPAPVPLPPIMAFDAAVDYAARAVFGNAPAPEAAPATVVIDPLIDGMTGYQSKATRSIQDRILKVAKSNFPEYAAEPITPDSLRRQPRVLLGTFTPVNAQMKTSIGDREAYRFCLVMADLRSGKVIAKSVVRVPLQEADNTPLAVFGDSPVWTDDPAVKAYVATCQASKVGDPIKPEYVDGLLAAAVVSEAGNAYDEGHYAEALDLYNTALKTPAGEQLRVYNGIYLALAKLGRSAQATSAFGDLVDYGLRTKRLAVKILFRPGSVRFASETAFGGIYDTWLQTIASTAAANHACLQVVGHTSPTGPAAMNDSLSLLRAEYVQSRLETDEPALKKRTVAMGVGSRENLIGTGRDDATDMLDRRVEFKPIEPCS